MSSSHFGFGFVGFDTHIEGRCTAREGGMEAVNGGSYSDAEDPDLGAARSGWVVMGGENRTSSVGENRSSSWPWTLVSESGRRISDTGSLLCSIQNSPLIVLLLLVTLESVLDALSLASCSGSIYVKCTSMSHVDAVE